MDTARESVTLSEQSFTFKLPPNYKLQYYVPREASATVSEIDYRDRLHSNHSQLP